MKQSTAGFTLIELVIFIILAGIICNIIVISYTGVLKGTTHVSYENQAIQTASRCMEWYLGQRFSNGFSATSLTASTSTSSFCSVPTGYTISSAITSTTLYSDSSANYKTITVTVTGQQDQATLSSIIASY